jgi:hypothetical protein
LQQLYRNKPVQSWNVALTAQEEVKQVSLYRLSFCSMRWASGLSSLDRATLIHQIESGYVASQCRKYGIPLPTSAEKMIESIEVPAVSWAELLEPLEPKSMDLLVLDTEGLEYELLSCFPWDKYRVRALLFEHEHLNKTQRKALQQKLDEMNYTCRKFDRDLFCTRET